jgi:hypothetical protein
VLGEADLSEVERIGLAYRLSTGRKPTSQEAGIVQAFLASQRSRIESGELKADEIISGKMPARIDSKEAAAWMVTARVLLNLDETLNKN